MEHLGFPVEKMASKAENESVLRHRITQNIRSLTGNSWGVILERQGQGVHYSSQRVIALRKGESY